MNYRVDKEVERINIHQQNIRELGASIDAFDKQTDLIGMKIPIVHI